MKIAKVVLFRVTPIIAYFNDKMECIGEDMAPTINVYPGIGFNANETIRDLESRYSNELIGTSEVGRTELQGRNGISSRISTEGEDFIRNLRENKAEDGE